MDPFLDFLFNNPFVLIFLGIWGISLLGNVMKAAAKRAVQQQRSGQASADPRGSRGPVAAPRPAPERRGPDPEEVAAELRRALGLAPSPEPVASTWEDDDDPWSDEPELSEPEPTRAHGLAERAELGSGTAHRTIDDEHLVTSIVDYEGSRIKASEGLGSLAGRAKFGGQAAVQGRRSRRRRSRFARIGDPAEAIIMMEIMGPPKALRDPE
ncbi:MAG: hypothetical protein QF412_06770 [Planctomycetota bacterium]|jgi:hypothetical protein|nr:hypothetical protein [Planctomycetota bacterium]